MSVPVVYEGQVGGNEGTLFKDLKFWVAHRVPQRATWVQDIESNGGTIEKLEKKADYLIADHARRDVPAGSYSWRWIEESVRDGRLLDHNDYVINRSASENRPVGSVQQKSTRSAFTAADDMLLRKFVTRHEAAGVATSGNVIYRHLEEKYPHHTFHSWRDRWLKKLQYLPRPHVSDDELPRPPDNAPRPPAARAPPRGDVSQSSPARSVAASSKGGVRGSRIKFTKMEDDLLIQYVTKLEQHGKPTGGRKLYEDFAGDFPQHTWHSWRDRWLKILKPRLQRQEEDEEDGGIARTTAVEPVQEEAQPASSVSSPVLNGTALPPAAGEAAPEVRQEHLNPDPAEVEAKGPQPDADDCNREKNRETSPSTQRRIAVPSSPAIYSESPVHETRELLYRDLRAFLNEESQMEIQLDLRPTIQGRTFELWDLWQAVLAQKAEPAERDWQLITETLGYNWIELPNAPDEIREWYENHLAWFEENLMRFEAEDLTEENEDEDREGTPKVDGPANGAHKVRGRVPEPYNSSPPAQPSRKRTFHPAISSDNVYPDSRKRPKLSRDSEIPSTPDTRNGTSHLRHPVSAAVSPVDRRRSSLPKSSRTASEKGKGKQVAIDDFEREDQVPELPLLPSSRRAAVEPETQDFRFDTQTQGIMFDDEDPLEEFQNDITPSQQLHSEFDARSVDHPFSAPRRVVSQQQLDAQTTPTPKRHVKSPFLMDNDDDDAEQPTPKARYGKGPNPLLANPQMLDIKRRSMPALLARSPQPATERKSMPGPSQPMAQLLSPPHKASTLSAPSPSPALSRAERLSEAVEYWMSLGYSHHIARRCLEATTWEPGLAGRVMQVLKNGGSMPTNWEGVWTTRDDEGLMLVNSVEVVLSDKETKKRKKTFDRLVNKHGEGRMAMRRKWLATKAKS
ncbi:TRF2-interacting telomeric protein/Rap1 C terminal domain-containing protein [Xylariales sp. AK1849]|nr:TRF2-interacting telomeric protein/Rap1 C terminal domain-containing protein [Xylariales sp. AK1849]